MSKEIAIVSIWGRTITVIEPNKEPENFSSGGNVFSHTPISIKLHEVLTTLYSEGYSLETSNDFTNCQTYVLVRGK